MTLKDIWLQHQLQQLAEIAKILDREQKIAQRREQNQIFQQQMAQQLHAFRQEYDQRQKLWEEFCQKALEEEQQRQTKIAERRQEVARQKQRNQQEILAIREYVWGSQAEAVSLTKS